MKKMFLIAVLLVATMSTYAQQVGVSYSSQNSITMNVIEKENHILYGIGTSWFKNEVKTIGVFGEAGYEFNNGLQLLGRVGTKSGGDLNLLYGGSVGLPISKRIVYTVGMDNRNKYFAGLTFKL